MIRRYDVIVVGAGPIGAYTAYQLADKGFDVCLLDEKKQIGTDVVCAGVVGKEAFKRYDLPTASIVSRIDSFSFVSPHAQRLEYTSHDVLAYVVDRKKFDRGIVTLARKCGVDVHLNRRVYAIKKNAREYIVTSNHGRFCGKAVVIATGINYDLHKKIGLGRPQKFLYGSQIEIPHAFSLTNIDLHLGHSFAPGSLGWLIPVGNRVSRVGVIIQRRGKQWLKRMLEKRLGLSSSKFNENAFKIKPIAFGPVKRSVKGNILVVGEAAGQVKTTTGGGIFFGLLCSEIAVDRLAKTLKNDNNLHDYEITWRSTLISELDIGMHLRSVAARLSDEEIENLFSFVKKNRFWVQFLLPRINFDYHSNALFFCLKSFGSILHLPEK
jgi:geranylgeranyl reductase family protein